MNTVLSPPRSPEFSPIPVIETPSNDKPEVLSSQHEFEEIQGYIKQKIGVECSIDAIFKKCKTNGVTCEKIRKQLIKERKYIVENADCDRRARAVLFSSIGGGIGGCVAIGGTYALGFPCLPGYLISSCIANVTCCVTCAVANNCLTSNFGPRVAKIDSLIREVKSIRTEQVSNLDERMIKLSCRRSFISRYDSLCGEKLSYQQLKVLRELDPEKFADLLYLLEFSDLQKKVWECVVELETSDVDTVVEKLAEASFQEYIADEPLIFIGILQHIEKDCFKDDRLMDVLIGFVKKYLLEGEDKNLEDDHIKEIIMTFANGYSSRNAKPAKVLSPPTVSMQE